MQIYSAPKSVLEDEKKKKTLKIMESVGVRIEEKEDRVDVHFLNGVDVRALMEKFPEVEELNLKKLFERVK